LGSSNQGVPVVAARDCVNDNGHAFEFVSARETQSWESRSRSLATGTNQPSLLPNCTAAPTAL
jgi:hypothetical protein